MASKAIDITAVKAKAAAKADPKASKATDKASKADTYKLHLNRTGRLCIGKEAAERMGEAPFCKLSIEGKTVRLEPSKKESADALAVRYADPEYQVRPYVSASKAFKTLGWDGAEGIDIEAKPYGSSGFEFRLS